MIRKKGDGPGVMLSGFICETAGWLQITPEQRERINKRRAEAGLCPLPADYDSSCEYFEYGKNRDGWWDSDKMIKQTDFVISIFEELYPGYQAVFLFDWSSGHAKYADDALNANRMNVGIGGKQPKMHDTWWKDAGGDNHTQTMVFKENETPFAACVGQAKGMKQVLQERGKYREGMTADGWKSVLVTGEDGRQERKRVRFPELDMTLILSNEPDFKAEKSQLQLFIEARGHVCDFLPKYHCELSAIESKWGRSKFFLRMFCEYNMKSMLELIPVSLGLEPLPPDPKYGPANLYGSFSASPLRFTRKLFRKSRDFMRSYQAGGRGKKEERAVFKAHRRPAPSEFGDSAALVVAALAARQAPAAASAADAAPEAPPPATAGRGGRVRRPRVPMSL